MPRLLGSDDYGSGSGTTSGGRTHRWKEFKTPLIGMGSGAAPMPWSVSPTKRIVTTDGQQSFTIEDTCSCCGGSSVICTCAGGGGTTQCTCCNFGGADPRTIWFDAELIKIGGVEADRYSGHYKLFHSLLLSGAGSMCTWWMCSSSSRNTLCGPTNGVLHNGDYWCTGCVPDSTYGCGTGYSDVFQAGMTCYGTSGTADSYDFAILPSFICPYTIIDFGAPDHAPPATCSPFLAVWRRVIYAPGSTTPYQPCCDDPAAGGNTYQLTITDGT